MSDQAQQPSPVDRGLEQLEAVQARLDHLCAELASQRVPAELAAIVFDGKAGLVEHVDDVGAPCLSYAVYNPTEFSVFVAMQGGPARPGAGCLEVPKQKLVVFPFAVSGHISLGVDAQAIEEEQAQVFRARFHTVQPFFVGALA